MHKKPESCFGKLSYVLCICHSHHGHWILHEMTLQHHTQQTLSRMLLRISWMTIKWIYTLWEQTVNCSTTLSRGKVRLTWICIAPCRDHTSKVLRYGMHSQGISQFYLHTPRSSANGIRSVLGLYRDWEFPILFFPWKLCVDGNRHAAVWEWELLHCARRECESKTHFYRPQVPQVMLLSSADQTPKTLLVLDFALQHAAISKFQAARRTLEAVHSLSPGRCSGTDFLQKSGRTTHCRVSSLSLRHTISDSNHV